MKPLIALLALAAIPLWPSLFEGSRGQVTAATLEEINGEPVYQETIVAGVVVAGTNATPFPQGGRVLVQCDGSAWLRPGGTASSVNGISVGLQEKVYIGLQRGDTTISGKGNGGSVNCKFFVVN